MNFFKKNLFACLQLIIVIILLLLRFPLAEGATATVAGSTAKDMSRRGQYSELTFSSLYQNQPGSYLKPKTSLPAPSSEAKVTLTQPLDYNLASDDDKSSVDWPEVARVYRLYNLRSSRDLLIQDDKVSATGTNADEKGDLGLESVLKRNIVRTKIRGLSTDKYMCFNKKGRLVTKPKKKARGNNCEFIEETTDAGSRFSSVYNNRWHIGFTTNGQALNGAAYDPNHQQENITLSFSCPACFLFMKTSSLHHKYKYPANYTQNNFDPIGHNQAIGQIHPGVISPDEFLSEFSFPTVSLAPASASASASSSSSSTRNESSDISNRNENNTKHRHRHHHRRRKPKRKKNKESNNKTSSIDRISNKSNLSYNLNDRNSLNQDDASHNSNRIIKGSTGDTLLPSVSSLQQQQQRPPLILSLPMFESLNTNQTREEDPVEVPIPNTSSPTTTRPPLKIPRLRRLQKSHRKSAKKATASTTTETPTTTTTAIPSTTTTTATTPTTTASTLPPPLFSKPMYYMQRRRPRQHHHHHFQAQTATKLTNLSKLMNR